MDPKNPKSKNLKVLSNYRDVGLIFTMPNADAKNNSFIKAILVAPGIVFHQIR